MRHSLPTGKNCIQFSEELLWDAVTAGVKAPVPMSDSNGLWVQEEILYQSQMVTQCLDQVEERMAEESGARRKHDRPKLSRSERSSDFVG